MAPPPENEASEPASDQKEAAGETLIQARERLENRGGGANKRAASLRAELDKMVRSSLGEAAAQIPGERYNHVLECLVNFTSPLDDSAYHVSYLIESIARTIERCAKNDSPNPKDQEHVAERFAAAKQLHKLATRADREALARTIAELKQLIRDVEGLHQRIRILSDTSSAAQQELNQTEHQLYEARDALDKLVAEAVERVDSAQLSREAQTAADRRKSSLERVDAAKELLAVLARNAGAGSAAPAAAADPEVEAERDRLSARNVELETELQSAISERDAMREELEQTAALKATVERLEGELQEARNQPPPPPPGDDQRVAELEEAKGELASRVEELEQQLAAASERTESAQAEESEHLAALQREKEELAGTVAERDERIAELEAQIATSGGDVGELETRLAEAERVAEAAEAEAERLAGRYEEEKEGLSSALDAKQQLLEELEQKVEATDQLETRIEELETELREQREAAEAKGAEVDEASRAEAEQHKAEAERLQQQVDDLLAARNEWLTERENMQSLLDDYAASSNQHEGNVGSLQQALNEQGRELDRLSDERDSLQSELVQSRERLTMLEAELHSLKTQKDEVGAEAASAVSQAAETERALNQQIESLEEQRVQESRHYEEQLADLRRELDNTRSSDDELRDRNSALHAALVAACHQSASIGRAWITACDQLDSEGDDLDLGSIRADLAGLAETLDSLAEQEHLDAHAVAEPCTVLSERCNDLATALGEGWDALHNRRVELEEQLADLQDERAAKERLQRELEDEQERVAAQIAQGEELDGQLAEVQEQLQATRGELVTANARVAELEADLEGMRTESESQRSEAGVQLAQAERRIVQLSQDLEARSERISELEASGKDSEHQRERLAVALRQLGSGLGALVPADDSADDSLIAQAGGELRNAMDRAETDAALVEVAAEVASEGLSLARTLADERRRALAEQADATARAERAEEELTSTRARVEELEARLAEVQGELARASDELEATRARVEEVSSEEAEHAHELTELRRELAGLQVDLDAARDQVAERDKELAELRPVSGQLEDVQGELAAAHTASDQAKTAMSEILRQVRDLTENVNERVDALGLRFGGGTKRFARTHMTLTKAAEKGVSEDAPNLAHQALAQVREQVAAMHDQLSKLRSQEIEQEQTINVLKQDATQKQSRVQELETMRIELETKVGELSQSDAVHVAERDEAKTKAGELSRRIEEQTKEHQQRLRSVSSEIDETKAMSQEARELLERERDEAKAQVEKLVAERDELTARVDELSDQLVALESGTTTRIQELERTLDQREERIAELGTTLDQLKTDRQEQRGLQSRITVLNQKLSDANREIVALQAKADLHDPDELAALQHSLRESRSESASLRRDVSRLERQIHQEQARVQSLEQAHSKKENSWLRRIERVEERHQLDKDALATAQEDLRRLRRELAGTKARLRTVTRS